MIWRFFIIPINLLRPACRRRFKITLKRLVETMTVEAELAIASKVGFGWSYGDI
jgi:hypothetical protein